ncbi:GlxA family transcriptional regulator [Pseudochelatococcus sp. B33]
MAVDAYPERRIGFLLLPNFTLLSYASAVEPLRAANRLSGRQLYRWLNISLDGAPSVASSGASIPADGRVGDELDLDMIFVCGGRKPIRKASDASVIEWLRRLSRRGTTIGGIAGGPYFLARAGLLKGRRCTIHWEYAEGFSEEFPDLDLRKTVYEIDGNFVTCGGGVAAFDMIHTVIKSHHGHILAAYVSDWFVYSRVREGGPQRMPLRERYGISNQKLLSVLEYMESQIENPASREELASLAGVSPRQLDRLFGIHLKKTAAEYYLHVRLVHARALLRYTALSILEVAIACGFSSASHFSRSYRAHFDKPPSKERLFQSSILDFER